MDSSPASVLAVAGLRKDFFARHRKDRRRADDAWRALIAKQAALSADPLLGDVIQRHLRPHQFKRLPILLRLALPNGFRALYSILPVPGQGRVVSIEWIGDHKEYDRLFGYSTS